MATAPHQLVAFSRHALLSALRRLRADDKGLGLVDLLIAMGVLAIAITAQLAVFASSYTR